MTEPTGDLQLDRKNLEEERDFILSWQNHPITFELFRDMEESEKALESIVLDHDPCDVLTLLSHFNAIGALREIRRRKVLVAGKLEELQEKLKNIE